MPTTFTLHDRSNGLHWFPFKAYESDEIDQIKPPDGGKTEKQPTSIPSPFARMDLVRAAFENLVRFPFLSDPSGKTYSDEQIVSDCFDIGEIFFNYEELKNRIQIVPWSPHTDLDRLINEKNPDYKGNNGHKRLGEALRLFLDQDSKTYNFAQIKRLFILKYGGKAIGGTSPATLFFTSGNDLSEIKLSLGDHRLFDEKSITPLYQRNIEYQKYWYGLQAFMPHFRDYFQAVDDYLTKSQDLLEQADPELYNQHIKDNKGTFLITEKSFLQNFDGMDTGKAGDNVEVLGYQLRKKKPNLVAIEQGSDFSIRSDKYKRLYPDALLPLVLQNRFYSELTYVPQSKWNPSVPVPLTNPLPYYPNQRTLPGQPTKYPYLTVSDFLEPYLIQLAYPGAKQIPYPINRDCFFNGNLMGAENSGAENKMGYLLPLKAEFFNFFDVEDLYNGKVKMHMNIRPGEGSVRVTLDIPIKKRGEFIQFERTYSVPVSDIAKPDLTNSTGGVIKKKSFTINLYPFIRSGARPEQKIPSPDYRIQLIEAGYDKYDKYQLTAFQQGTNKILNGFVPPIDRTARSEEVRGSSHYTVLDKEFDYLNLAITTDDDTINGLLMPRWKIYDGGGQAFTFAVDFGTTNTHIEYKIGEHGMPQPFTITERTAQVATLVSSEAYSLANAPLLQELHILYNLEFVPLLLGAGQPDTFPARTALAEKPNQSFSRTTIALADFNIPFYIERQPVSKTVDLKRNLKWAKSDDNNNRRVKAFLEELMLLIKNKVLLEGGDLEATVIRWFYPASMSRGRIGIIRRNWRELYSTHFGQKSDTNVQELSESVAPFYFYLAKDTTTDADVAVNIDIGGGTTDVVIYNRTPQLVTSFRFAGNTIYGDGFSALGAVERNGFVKKYKTKMADLLKDLGELRETNEQLLQDKDKRSEDVIAFWFSIVKSDKATDKNLYSFNQMLASDEELRIVFVLFYVAILYHIAQLMKARQLAMPTSLTFSGTGSKLLNIVTTDEVILQELSQLIFERVMEKKYVANTKLTVYADRNEPKEATCRGALMMTNEQRIQKPQDVVFMGNAPILTQSLTYADLKKEEIIMALVTEVEQFLTFFFDLHREFNFKDNLIVSGNSLNTARSQVSTNLKGFLKRGISKKLQDMEGEEKEDHEALEEPLFFYPLIGTINSLASQIGGTASQNIGAQTA